MIAETDLGLSGSALPPAILTSQSAMLAAALQQNVSGQTVGTEKSTIVAPAYVPSTFTPPPLTVGSFALSQNTIIAIVVIAIIVLMMKD